MIDRSVPWLTGVVLAVTPPAALAASGGAAPAGSAARAVASASASASASAGVAPRPALGAEITVLHATNDADAGPGIDPRIGSLPQLAKPPFSSYASYRLLSRTRLPIEAATPASTALPNGRTLQVSLRDVLAAQKRFRVAASINQPGGSTFLPLVEVTIPPGEPFFVAGQAYQGGILVVGIRLVP
jgi:hypothetical protein